MQTEDATTAETTDPDVEEVAVTNKTKFVPTELALVLTSMWWILLQLQ